MLTRILAIQQCVVLALLAPTAELSFAEGPLPSTYRGQENEEPVDFKIDDVRQISQQLRWREVAIIDCCRVLSWRLEGKLDDPENWHAASAARLLGSLRAGDVQAIELLCKNLTLQPGVSFDGLSNVAGITSRGLCGIGEQAIVPGTEMIVA